MSADDLSIDPVQRSVAAYSAYADEYEAAHASKRADIVARFAASLPTPSLILDVGCGPGRDLERFVMHGHVARGVELNPEFLARARRHAPTTQSDLRNVAGCYPSEFFDGIWRLRRSCTCRHPTCSTCSANSACSCGQEESSS